MYSYILRIKYLPIENNKYISKQKDNPGKKFLCGWNTVIIIQQEKEVKISFENQIFVSKSKLVKRIS